MKITIKKEIQSCDQCSFADALRVYTLDPFDHCRSIKCKKLDKQIHDCLDWDDKAKIPEECPFNI